jgi:hypothetical protein
MLSREDNELLVAPGEPWVPTATPRIVVRPGRALQLA